MNLSENYILQLKNLAGIVSENRINKLHAEKYPEEIINFVTNFAKETTRDSSKINIENNQYIPWIAFQVKNNPNIMNEKDKLSVIIHWIKNSGYNKINSTESFDSVYDKAKEWLTSKNINLSTGERVEGGKVVKKYPNGFQWIQATEVNWCINAGEKHGWCFNQLNRAEKFVGLGDIGVNSKGYFLLDDKHNPIIALQYDSRAKIIEDIQGAFNTPLNATLLTFAFDLFKELPLITDIKGHQESFWKSFDFEGADKFKQELLKIPNVSFDINKKLDYKLPLSKDEFDKLPVYKKLRFQLPLTKEEIASLSIKDKIEYEYATKEELMIVPVHLKIEYHIPLTTSDVNKLNQPILKKLEQILRKKANPQDLFYENNFDGFSDFVIDEDGIQIKMTEDEYEKKYSGLDEYERYYLHYDGSEETVEDDELDYMSHYLDKKNLDKIKYLAKILGVTNKYNFEDSANIRLFINENLQNFENIFDEYKTWLGTGIGKAKEKSIDKELLTEQPFKFANDYLILPWKKLYKFLKNNSHNGITKFKDLENLNINGEISLENVISDYQELDKQDVEYINNNVAYELDKSLKMIESNPEYAENVQEFQELISGLKFEEGDFSIYGKNHYKVTTHLGNAIYKLELPYKTIFIQGVDYTEKKISIFIKEFTSKKKEKVKKMLKGKIPYENLVNYTQQYALFEEKIKQVVRKMLSEGGNFRYADKNDKDVATFIPSREVIQTAQNAIQTVQNNKLVQSDASNEGSGLQKANSLVASEPMTHAQLKRMKAFFDSNAEVVQKEKSLGKNINNSPLIQKWELWGGDAGKTWAEKQLSSQQSSNKTSKKIRNPEHGVDTKTLMSPHNTRIHR